MWGSSHAQVSGSANNHVKVIHESVLEAWGRDKLLHKGGSLDAAGGMGMGGSQKAGGARNALLRSSVPEAHLPRCFFVICEGPGERPEWATDAGWQHQGRCGAARAARAHPAPHPAATLAAGQARSRLSSPGGAELPRLGPQQLDEAGKRPRKASVVINGHLRGGCRQPYSFPSRPIDVEDDAQLDKAAAHVAPRMQRFGAASLRSMLLPPASPPWMCRRRDK